MGDYRLVVLGSGAVGKTSLVEQFLNADFDNTYVPTVDEIYRRTVQLPDNDFHSVEILDTAGLHQFPAMRHVSIQSGRAFIVAYAVNNASSFKSALSLADLVKQVKGTEGGAIILVGNKCDLRDARQVTEEEAKREAQSRNCAFIETSAKCNYNVQNVFMELLMKMFEVDQRFKSRTATTQRKLLQTIFRKQADRTNNNISNDRCLLM